MNMSKMSGAWLDGLVNIVQFFVERRTWGVSSIR